jgi:hypothetical protein
VNPLQAPTATPFAAPLRETIQPTPTAVTIETRSPPVAVEYNLGETTITQSLFPKDSRFHNMPVRLNGLIAVPSGKDAPYPVVVILHGNHLGCPFTEEDMLDRWPCDPEVEQPNYRGFDYLVRRLADQGYVALSLNINAEYTLGFGEPIPNERLDQLVDLHLKALAEASSGGLNNFGVELKGRTDLSRLAFIGHSQGGEGAFWLIQNARLDSLDAYAKHGYGPVSGLLLVAPSANIGGAGGARLPLAVILPACDDDVFLQEGQLFYEITRLDPEQNAWASSIWLEHANHNSFNEILHNEAAARPERPDCEPLLEPETQRDFLSSYALDFLETIFSQDTGLEGAAVSRLGMDLSAPAPGELYGLPSRVAALASKPNRLPLLLPASDKELETNLAGGSVSAVAVTAFYCEAGYYTPMVKPGSEPCKRVNLTIPGNPAMLVLSWSQAGGELRFSLPQAGDLNQFTAVSLRAAVDPLSPLNNPDSFQAFSVRLTDDQGNSATVQTRQKEPALQFPQGELQDNEPFEGGLFTGRVPLTSIRLLLRDFTGVDLSAIQEVAVLFDQSPSGSLFISDIEIVK